jgi:hypothetical protein
MSRRFDAQLAGDWNHSIIQPLSKLGLDATKKIPGEGFKRP